MLQILAAALSALAADPNAMDEPGRDPLGPAQSGMVQCIEPDTATHTCRSMAAYRRGGDGGWIKTATILPDPAQPLVLDIDTPVVERDGAVCGTFRLAQVLAAKLRFFDRPVPAQGAMPVLGQVANALAPVFDHELCTRYVVVPGGLVARATLAGVATTIPDQRVIWVRSDAGFHVQPQNQAGNGR